MDTSVFPVLLLLACCGGTRVEGAAAVLPPTNVTLHCHNMKNTLQWSYDQLSDGIKFRVMVLSLTREAVPLLVRSPSTSIDLSEFSDPNNEYMVMVSAVKDGVESESIPEDGLVYSYFKDSAVTIKCNVDFPSVNLTTEDKHLHFSFTHPELLYPTSNKARKRKSPDSRGLSDFIYHIEVINQEESHEYHCTESVCQDKLPVHNSEKSYCLNMTGELNKMSVQTTKEYCSEPLESRINYFAVALPLALLGFGLLIGAMIVYKKTRPTPTDLRSLNFSRINDSPESPDSRVNPEFSSVCVGPSSTAPLVPPAQDTSACSVPDTQDLRFRLGVAACGEEEEEEVAGPACTPEDGYTEGKYLEEEEVPHCYEPRIKTSECV